MPNITEIRDRIGNFVFALLTNIPPLRFRIENRVVGEWNSVDAETILNDIEESAQAINDYIADLADPQWTAEWPTEPGAYWVFGYFSKPTLALNNRVRLELAHVRKVSNGVARYCGSLFLYESEACLLWLPATLPTPPPESMIPVPPIEGV